jgi:hypothetical protein
MYISIFTEEQETMARDVFLKLKNKPTYHVKWREWFAESTFEYFIPHKLIRVQGRSFKMLGVIHERDGSLRHTSLILASRYCRTFVDEWEIDIEKMAELEINRLLCSE